MNKTEKSLFACLEYCEVAQLPEAWDKKSVWVTAIAKIQKYDGNSYYCYMEKDNEGKPNIVSDFGSIYAILKTEEVYPLIYLDSSYVKKFPKSDEGTANLIEYLKSNGLLEAEHSDNRKELERMNINLAIRKQLVDEKKKNKLIIKD